MINFSKYINLPYKNLGRSFDGVDCYGLIWLIYKGELGIELPDFTELCYSQQWYKEKEDSIITENIDRRWVSVVPPFKKFDGVIFYKHPKSEMANHVGMMIDSNKFIHIRENSTSEISELNSNYWKSRFYGGMRYNGINNI